MPVTATRLLRPRNDGGNRNPGRTDRLQNFPWETELLNTVVLVFFDHEAAMLQINFRQVPDSPTAFFVFQKLNWCLYRCNIDLS